MTTSAARGVTRAWYHARLRRAASPRTLATCAALVAALEGACQPAAGAAVGRSSAREANREPSRRASPPVARRRWEGFERMRSWAPLGEPFPSRDHALGRYVASLYVSPEAREAYRTLTSSTVLPRGAILAERLDEPGSGRPVAFYAMQKAEDGRWRYLVVGPSGELQPGSTELCQRCHAEAPGDELYGVPPGVATTASD